MLKTSSLVAMLLLGLLPPIAHATPILDGGSVVPASEAFTGTLVATTTKNVTTPTYTASITSSVYREANGSLAFTDQFTNTSGSSGDILVRLIASDFEGFSTDVFYDQTSSGQIIPTKVTRSSGSVYFYFPDALGVHPGQTSSLLIIQTNATSFAAGNTMVKDSYTATIDSFAPATPEPASLGIITLGSLILLTRYRTITALPKDANR